MPNNTFQMITQKRGRMKYLLITIYVPLLFMILLSLLMKRGIFPKTPIVFYLSMAAITVLGYFLIFKKNHSIQIQDNTITETDWLRKNTQEIKAAQVCCFRRNFLGEIILLDKNGKKLLCVEKNMSNFDLFQQWLEQHNIYKM